MEVYLNIIEYGDGIYGIEAAAQHYFHTSAKKLTTYQASLLAGLLPNPRYYQHHLYGYALQARASNIRRSMQRVSWDKATKSFVRGIK